MTSVLISWRIASANLICENVSIVRAVLKEMVYWDV